MKCRCSPLIIGGEQKRGRVQMGLVFVSSHDSVGNKQPTGTEQLQHCFCLGILISKPEGICDAADKDVFKSCP